MVETAYTDTLFLCSFGRNKWRKIHPPHSRDFSRELGGWRFTSQKAFLCSDDQKVLSAKIPSKHIGFGVLFIA